MYQVLLLLSLALEVEVLVFTIVMWHRTRSSPLSPRSRTEPGPTARSGMSFVGRGEQPVRWMGRRGVGRWGGGEVGEGVEEADGSEGCAVGEVGGACGGGGGGVAVVAVGAVGAVGADGGGLRG